MSNTERKHEVMTEFTNNDRSSAAAKALSAFANAVCPGGIDESAAVNQQTLQDLLCNLRHLAHAQGLDFPAAVTAGNDHYRRQANEDSLTGQLIKALADDEDPDACIRLDDDCRARLEGDAREWSLPEPLLTRAQARQGLAEFPDADTFAATLQKP